VARYLSPEWLDQVDAVARGSEELPGLVGDVRLVVQQVVGGAPDGDVRYAVRIEDGGVSVVSGEAADADVTVREDYETAVALHRGELRAPVAFMTGRIAVSGDLQALHRAQPVLHRLDGVFAGLRDRTTYGP
jgi:hypothetical protein